MESDRALLRGATGAIWTIALVSIVAISLTSLKGATILMVREGERELKFRLVFFFHRRDRSQ